MANIFRLIVRPFSVLVERYYPDAFVFAILMSILAFIMALLLTDSSPAETITAWGDGLPLLMAFTAQLSITLLGAHALAHTDSVQRLLRKVGGIPKTAPSAYMLVVVSAALGSLIAWSLGLVVGATLAREVAIQCARRGIVVHFPLLVASAYGGFVVWHMGYSASAALFVATPGHTLEPIIGIIPITETIFTWQNGAVAAVTIIVLAIICPMMRPAERDAIQIDTTLLEQLPTSGEEQDIEQQTHRTPAERLENMRSISFILGATLMIYIAVSFVQKGFFLTLDIVNWSLVGLGLLLARSASHYIRLIYDATSSIGAIIIQYPFYAGMLGIMTTTGLVQVISGWFVSTASAETLPLFAFLSAGVINLFIPSGGGQWAVQGPVFIDAAQQLGTAPEVIVLAIAYGDQWTNMIQPFWTIPLLAIAGLHVRQIMGYTVVIFLVTMVIFGGSLLLMSATG